MKRIIIFDGLDCIGKTTVISNLELEIKNNNFIPLIFHLNGPSDYCTNLYNSYEINNFDKSIIQWTKFYQLFETLSEILSSNPRNVVILDRSPYSEFIWEKFFNRTSDLNCKKQLIHFCEYFKKLSDEIQYIHLDVTTKIIETRLYQKTDDLLNYNTFALKNANTTPISMLELSDTATAIEMLKKEFYNLYSILSKYNIDVKFFDNNSVADIKPICDYLINKV